MRRHVDGAIASGAEVLVGGVESIGERRIDPIVLVDADESCSAVQEEPFGPTVTVRTVKDVDQTEYMASTFDQWVASLDGSVSPDAKLLLRRAFDENRPVSREVARRIGHTHQLALARQAVELVGHDIAATTELMPPPFD